MANQPAFVNEIECNLRWMTEIFRVADKATLVYSHRLKLLKVYSILQPIPAEDRVNLIDLFILEVMV